MPTMTIETQAGPRTADVLAELSVTLMARRFNLAVTQVGARVALTHAASGCALADLSPRARDWHVTGLAAFSTLIAKRGPVIVHHALVSAETDER